MNDCKRFTLVKEARAWEDNLLVRHDCCMNDNYFLSGYIYI